MSDAPRLLAEDVFLADVLAVGNPPRLLRVIGIFDDRLIVFALEDPSLLPLEVLALDSFDAEDTIRLVTDHGFGVSVDEARLSEKRRKRRTATFAMIQPLLDLGDDIFDGKKRTDRISSIVHAVPDGGRRGPDRKTVVGALDRFWRFGMTATAAMPSFAGIGGPGVRKTRGAAKLGRPRTVGSRPGTNITPELEAVIKVGLRRYYLSNRRMNFEDARKMILRDACMDRRVDPETRRVVFATKPLYEQQDFPSSAQIRRWADQNADMLGFKRQRVGHKKYDRDLRGMTGNTARRAFGPGGRFEIDATVANIYVVSELEPESVIGRPIIYVVIDVFSKMLVGLYVGLEGPSWTGAMMALVNMVTPKVAFCAEHGITITEDEWPCHHLPEVLLADRGEIASRVIEALQANRHVTVENASAYRPDWKGTVEKSFHLLDCKLKPYTDSYVEPDFGERGASNYVLDAIWTVRDVTTAMIDTVLLLNNHRTISGYDRSAQMISDGVDAVPLDLWNWGIQRLSGRLRRADPAEVAFDVMPRSSASVTARGISHSGLRYTCELAEKANWFDRAKQGGAWAETVSFDPRSATHVYLHVPSHVDRRGYVVCDLVPAQSAFAGRTFAEVKRTLRDAKGRAADRSVERIEREMESATLKEEIEGRAKARLAGIKRRPRDVKDRRAVFSSEKAASQRREAFDLAPRDERHEAGGRVGPPAGAGEPEDDVSVPSIRRRMAGKPRTADEL